MALVMNVKDLSCSDRSTPFCSHDVSQSTDIQSAVEWSRNVTGEFMDDEQIIVGDDTFADLSSCCVFAPHLAEADVMDHFSLEEDGAVVAGDSGHVEEVSAVVSGDSGDVARVYRHQIALTCGLGDHVWVQSVRRGGTIVADDCTELPYKVRFSDSASMAKADWFRAVDVELVPKVGDMVQVKETGRLARIVIDLGRVDAPYRLCLQNEEPVSQQTRYDESEDWYKREELDLVPKVRDRVKVQATGRSGTILERHFDTSLYIVHFAHKSERSPQRYEFDAVTSPTVHAEVVQVHQEPQQFCIA